MNTIKQVYTIGYDLRPFEYFLKILVKYRISRIIDVRRWNTSRRLPFYSGKSLSERLAVHGIEYYWIPELGGYRKFGVDVEDYGIASCFESKGFRAYATYITMNPEVKPYLDKLVQLVSEKTSALLCREKLPWKCHRKILSDYLVSRGFRVIHIIEIDKVYEHRLHRCARIIDGKLIYK